MTKKFYKMTLAERHEYLLQNSNLKAEDLETWLPSSGLSFETADHMIENAVGLSHPMPIGVFPALALYVVRMAGFVMNATGKVTRLFVAVTGPLRFTYPQHICRPLE